MKSSLSPWYIVQEVLLFFKANFVVKMFNLIQCGVITVLTPKRKARATREIYQMSREASENINL